MKKLLIAVHDPGRGTTGDPAMARVTDLINTKMGCRPQPKNDFARQQEAIRVDTDEEGLRIATMGMGIAPYNAALTRYRLTRAACRDKGAA